MRNPTMIGDRVYLSPREESDAVALARWEAQETDANLYGVGRHPVSPIALAHFAREGHKEPPRSLFFTALLVDGDEPIGEVSLMGINYVNRTAETGSMMKPGEYRGRGYGTEAKLLLLEFAFDHLQLHVLQSHVFSGNQRSAAALRKQGYHLAGRMRYVEIHQGQYEDLLIFDITRPEWLATRERRSPAGSE